MRLLTVLCLLAAPSIALAQPDAAAAEAEEYVALSADQLAQLSLGGFRDYLERTREDDDVGLYEVLDPRLDELESRELAADVVFWTATGLGVAAVAVGIPLFSEYQNESLADVGLGLMIGGASAFLLGVIIQAVIRPNHDDLVRLIDAHDSHLGRR